MGCWKRVSSGPPHFPGGPFKPGFGLNGKHKPTRDVILSEAQRREEFAVSFFTVAVSPFTLVSYLFKTGLITEMTSPSSATIPSIPSITYRLLKKGRLTLMSIPDYQTLMLPLLKAAADGKEHRVADVVEQLAQEFHLTQEDRLQLLPSGRQTTFANRVAWAKSFLVQAGLLEGTKWGCFRIAARGNQVLSKNPPRIDNDYLLQFDDFVSFRNRGKTSEIIPGSTVVVEASEQDQTPTPDELIRNTVRQIDAALAKDILDRTILATPAFFENLVVKLLLAMGYGGSRADAGQIVGRPGDHGIDGIIDQDSLGLDRVYIQAKNTTETTKSANRKSEPSVAV